MDQRGPKAATAVRSAFFEITRTPPDVKRRQNDVLAEEEKAAAILQPCAFGQIPFLSYDNIPLGKTATRTLIIRNPSQKILHVHFEKIPKEEKGFNFNHEDFDLDGKSQATLEISWTPQNGTPLRETVIVKLGSLKSQLNLVATCKCPPPPKNLKKVGPPRRGAAPLAPPKFPSQKFFGPPTLSSIPDNDLQISEVNLKRQTFIPIQATMPQIQLPVISTPKHFTGVTNDDSTEESKENTGHNRGPPSRSLRHGQPLKTFNKTTATNESRFKTMTLKESKLKSKPEWKDVSLPDSQNNWGETFHESQQQEKKCETFFVEKCDAVTSDVPVTFILKDEEESIVETVVEQNFEEDNFDSFSFEIDQVREEKADTFKFDTLEEKTDTDKFDTLQVQSEAFSFESPIEKDDSFFSFEKTETQTTAMKLDTFSIEKADSLAVEKTAKEDTFSIENILKECEEDAAKAEEKSPEQKMSFSLNLSSLDLSLSPERSLKVTEKSVATDDLKSKIVVENADMRRASSGTYVTSPSFANLRDIASPNGDVALRRQPMQENQMELTGVAHFSTTAVVAKISFGNSDQLVADESMDDISLLIANELRLSGSNSIPGLNNKNLTGLVPSPSSASHKSPEKRKESKVIDPSASFLAPESMSTRIHESFLQNSVTENSFLPPSPSQDPRYCSTGVKEKVREETIVWNGERSSEIRRELFGQNGSLGSSKSAETCIRAGQFESICAPSLTTPEGSPDDRRFSSKTFVMTPDLPKLSIIEEEHDDSTKPSTAAMSAIRNTTFDKDVEEAAEEKVISEKERVKKSIAIEISPPAKVIAGPKQELSLTISPPAKIASPVRRAFSSNRRSDVAAASFQPPISNSRSAFSSTNRLSSMTQNRRSIAVTKTVTTYKSSITTVQTSTSRSVSVPDKPKSLQSKLLSSHIETNAQSKMNIDTKPSRKLSTIAETKEQPQSSLMADQPKIKPSPSPSKSQNDSEPSNLCDDASIFFVPLDKVPETEATILKPEVALKRPSSATSARRSIHPDKRSSLQSKRLVSSCRASVKTATSRLTLLKPAKASSSIVHHPNPFAARNMYYDERWIEKQENGFKKWLNFVLTPPDGFECSDNDRLLLAPGKLDVAKLWSACTKDVRVPRAPTREVLSMRAYSAQRQLKRLRRDSSTLWQSPGIAPIIIRIETEIEKQRLCIRSDRQMNKDLGIKKKLLILLLSYNPLWLHIGLETVFGEILPVSSLSDIIGISQFILNRLLSNPDILAQYAHPTVPYHYMPGHESALHQFTLKKFLQLVYFLDQAKTFRIIQHNPCLFCKDSPIKTSREILTSFSRDFLSGEGDIIKHLGYLGYKVVHQQVPIDEFDYAVTNIASDLRCGVRLCRVMEILLSDNSLTSKLRMPAVSRLQKVHNVDMALSALKSSKAGLPDSISSRDIVDGHMEKTLNLLWHIIFGFQLELILDAERLTKELSFLEKSLEYRVRIGDKLAQSGLHFILECKQRAVKKKLVDKTKDWTLSEKMQLLLQWARLVCAHYAIEIENLSVSFSDGRALCYLLHHYYPSFLKLEEICQETSQQQQSADNLDGSLNDSLGAAITYNYGKGAAFDPKFYEQCLSNEKQNFKLVFNKVTELGGVPMIIRSSEMSNTIPDQKVTATFLAYLSARLIDLSAEMTAARTIQLAWKHYIASKREKALKVANKAASVIQARVREFMRRRQMARYNEAALKIQTIVRGHLARKRVWKIRETIRLEHLSDATLVFQKHWRRCQAVKLRRKKMQVIVNIQSIVRMKQTRKRYLETLWHHSLVSASVVIQKHWRGQMARTLYSSMLVERECRINFAATAIQKHWRGYVQRTTYSAMKNSCIKIQSLLRGIVFRNRFVLMRRSVVLLQANVRRLIAQRQYVKSLCQIVKVQSCIRRYLARKQCNQMRHELQAALTIQSLWRMKLAQLKCLRIRSAVKIQKNWKGFVARQNYKVALRAQEKLHNEAALIIQKNWRSFVATQKYQLQRKSAVKIQSLIRRFQSVKQFHKQKMAVLCIQRYMRGLIGRRQFKAALMARQELQYQSALTIQTNWRSFVLVRKYQAIRTSIIRLQAEVKKHIAMKKYRQRRNAVVCLQKHLRGLIARQNYKAALMAREQLHNSSALTIQKNWRSFVQARNYRITCSSIIKVQAHVRKLIAMKEYRRQRSAAICLQKHVRELIARQNHKAALIAREQLHNRSALMIQKNWRSYVQAAKYQAQLSSIIKAQAQARTYITMKKYRKKKSAAICLQRHLRGLIARQNFKAALIARERHHYQSALIIQKNWRSFVQARKYQATLSSIIKVQAQVRKHIAMEKYRRQKTAVMCLQKHLRGSIARQNYKATLMARKQLHYHSALIVQKTWRSFVQFRKYQATRSSIIKVQAQARKYITLRNYRHKRLAAICLQKHTRGFVARKSYKANVNSRQRAALTIQTNWRTHVAMKKYQATRASAIKIQSAVRRYQAQVQYRKQIKSAICLQKNWRTFRARRNYKALIAARENLRQSSAIVLQMNWRSCIAKKRYQNTRNAIVKIQSVIRRHLALEEFKKKKLLAICLQKYWRGYKARHNYKASLVARERIRQNSAVTIQTNWRSFKAKQQYQATRANVIAVQAQVRRYLAMKEFGTTKKAAITLQKYMRGHIARINFKVALAAIEHTRQRAALTIQKNWRSMIAQKQYQTDRASIIKVQSFIRRRIAMEKFQEKRKAAIVLQTYWRKHSSKKKFNLIKCQAIILQSYFRRHLAQKRVEVIRQQLHIRKQNESALLIQTFWRMWQARHRYLEIMLHMKQTLAATQIQSRWRGYSAMKKYLANLAAIASQRQASAVIIQKNWRMFLAVRKYRALLVKVVLLQSLVRMTVARKSFVELRSKTIWLQARWRGQHARTKYLRTLENVRKTQSLVRRYLAKKRVSLIRAEILSDKQKRAALMFQTLWRGYTARQSYKNMLVMMAQQRDTAATVIQKNWKCFLTRKGYLAILHNIVKIQSIVRTKFAVKKFSEAKRSAITIQTCWRGFRMRKMFSQSVKDVTTVQAFVRRWLATRHVREIRRQLLIKKQTSSAIILQSFWRMKMTRQKFITVRSSTIIVQKAWRSYRLMKNIRCYYLKRRSSAIVLQKTWRSFAQQNAYRKILKNIVQVQALVRQRIVQSRYRKLKQAAISIQSHWRMKQCRNRYLKFQAASVIIQKNYRSHQQRSVYLATIKSIVLVQSLVRRRLALNNYNLAKCSAVVIQTQWRAHHARKEYRQTVSGIVKAQAHIRRFLAQKEYRRILLENRNKSALVIQSYWRMTHQKRKFQNILAQIRHTIASTIIQSYWRGYTARKQFQTVLFQRQNAAVTIQKNWNLYCARKFQKRAFSATIIQSFWRMKMTRILYLAALDLRRKESAAIVIQKYWRCYSAKQNYAAIQMQRQRAGTIIQKNWKRFVQMREYSRTIKKIVIVQSLVRRHLAMLQFFRSKRSVIQIQSWFRAYLAAKQFKAQMRQIVSLQSHARRFLAQKRVAAIREENRLIDHENRVKELKTRSAIIIQTQWRRHVTVKCRVTQEQKVARAAKVVQRVLVGWKFKKAFIVKRNAAKTIQAHWRGYRFRKGVKEEQARRLAQVRAKMNEAAKNATEAKKLCNRTAFALEFLYKSRDMSHLIGVLADLEVSTHYSTNCCIQMSGEDCRAVKILADLIQRCNRSVPHIEVISTAFEIFMNLAECKETRILMSRIPELFEAVVVCMNRNEMTPKVFCKGSAVLWKLTHQPEAVQILMRPGLSKKLSDFEKRHQSLGARQHSGAALRQRAASDVTMSRAQILSIKHLGHLASKVVRYHDNPSTAIRSLNHKIKTQITKYKLT